MYRPDEWWAWPTRRRLSLASGSMQQRDPGPEAPCDGGGVRERALRLSGAVQRDQNVPYHERCVLPGESFDSSRWVAQNGVRPVSFRPYGAYVILRQSRRSYAPAGKVPGNAYVIRIRPEDWVR